MKRTSTEIMDPLGLLTPNSKPRCLFGRPHSWVLGFYAYMDAAGNASGDYFAGATGVWADGYLKCFQCGQVEFDGMEAPSASAADEAGATEGQERDR